MASSSSDNEEIPKIEAVTAFSKAMPQETFDCPLFEREDEDDPRVMVERPAGSNEWYQYYYETESYNEIKLRSPATRKTSEHIEWIDRKSSRLSRVGLSTKLWKYIKGTDGAWVPRGTEQKKDVTEAKKGSKNLKKRGGGGEASDDTGGGDGNNNKKNKKPRVGHNKPGPKPGKGKNKATKYNKNDKDVSSSSSSGMDTDEEKAYNRNKAAMGALASWFIKHNNSLTLKLPGTAESAGLDHVMKKQQQQQQNKQRGDGGAGATATAGGNNIDTVVAAGGAGSSKPLVLPTAASRSLDKKLSIPKSVKNAAPLEDDDLFSSRNGKPRGLSKKPSGLTTIGSSGSGHMTPMNSLTSIHMKKDSQKIGGGPLPSRLGGGGLVSKPEEAVKKVSPVKRDFLKMDSSGPMSATALGSNPTKSNKLTRMESGGESSHGGGGDGKGAGHQN
jgi:hypothetical protein